MEWKAPKKRMTPDRARAHITQARGFDSTPHNYEKIDAASQELRD